MRICPDLSCPGGPEEWLDPDMYGIGIIIAFAVTAGLALFVSIAAVIRGAIPDYQYGWLDKKLLSKWLLAKVRKAPKERPENLGYQLFLLTLSDQILLTGIAYAITMYARICHLSVMSFQIGSTLIRLSSTVHFCTLIVLKLHFLEHRRQAGLRCVLMVVFLGLFFAVDFMASYTSLCNMRKFFFCELYSEAERPEFIVADCLAVFLTTSLLYWNGIRSIKPPKEDPAPDFSTTSTLYFFYSCGNKRADVDAYLLKKQAEWYSARERDNNILRQKPNFLKVFCITAPALLFEIYASSFLEVVLATLWFSTTIWGLSDVLSVLGSEIAEFSFGQIMPVLLLIVYAVTAMEVGNFKKPPKATVEDPSTSKPIQKFGLVVEAPVTTEGNLSQLDTSSERASFEDSNDGQTSSQAQCLLPESNSSNLEIASTIGPRTSTDSSSGLLRTPNRNNTLEMEEGRDASWPFKINLGESEFVS
ncbi:hypothetical protein BHE90_010227 [Fusarium euwallaceae]|uniref:Uncharacterized protein n=1 Tax=Fusarium euwallaceae TaxID=1147111 RepID=A0A430LI38_9HYPO|nr:hypothetical protein BHE90_010227 [Fusarium euwallaceae]